MARAYRNETAFSAAINKCCDSGADYDDAWVVCNGRFPKLEEFCGGLASIFPNTSTVESDFSVTGWETNEYRHCLTDFSLEGILQTKQFNSIYEI
jgi:hypothetical protein